MFNKFEQIFYDNFIIFKRREKLIIFTLFIAFWFVYFCISFYNWIWWCLIRRLSLSNGPFQGNIVNINQRRDNFDYWFFRADKNLILSSKQSRRIKFPSAGRSIIHNFSSDRKFYVYWENLKMFKNFTKLLIGQRTLLLLIFLRNQ